MLEEIKNKNEKERVEQLINSFGDSKSIGSGSLNFFSKTLSENSPLDNKNSDSLKQTKNLGLESRIEKLEKELSTEREKALRAEVLLKERENLRLEMETMLKNINEHIQYEKMNREMEQERINARARVEILEKRLEEMHQMLVDVLKEKNEASDNAFNQAFLRSLVQQKNELTSILQSKELEIEKLKSSNQTIDGYDKLIEKESQIQELTNKIKQLDSEKQLLNENIHTQNEKIAELLTLKESLKQEKEKNQALQREIAQWRNNCCKKEHELEK